MRDEFQKPVTATTIDVVEAGYVLGFVRRALRRQARPAKRAFYTVCLLAAGLALLLPAVYRVDCHILTHRSLILPALLHPDRKVPETPEISTEGALELIYSHDNLANIVDDFDLVRRFSRSRPLWLVYKDRAMQALFGKLSDQDKREIFVKMLGKNLEASLHDDVLQMAVSWPNAEIALGLGEMAVARFLKLRRDTELAEVYDTVRILERQVTQARQQIDTAVGRMQKLFNAKEKEIATGIAEDFGAPRPVLRKHTIVIRKVTPQQSRANAAAEQLRGRLHLARADLTNIKQAYEDRVRTAEQNLAALRESLGPNHPDVKEARQALEKAAMLPGELSNAQEDQSALAAQLGSVARLGGRGTAHVQVEMVQDTQAEAQNSVLQVRVSAALAKRLDSDSEVRSMLTEIRRREAAYEVLLNRLDFARLESEAANIAFESRYILTLPPVFPRSPQRPMGAIVLASGVALGLLAGLLTALLFDVGRGRIQEAWQVQRFLRLKVFGEIDE
jgi:hypothetical protein